MELANTIYMHGQGYVVKLILISNVSLNQVKLHPPPLPPAIIYSERPQVLANTASSYSLQLYSLRLSLQLCYIIIM